MVDLVIWQKQRGMQTPFASYTSIEVSRTTGSGKLIFSETHMIGRKENSSLFQNYIT